MGRKMPVRVKGLLSFLKYLPRLSTFLPDKAILRLQIPERKVLPCSARELWSHYTAHAQQLI